MSGTNRASLRACYTTSSTTRAYDARARRCAVLSYSVWEYQWVSPDGKGFHRKTLLKVLGQ
eukprot:1763383-Rhodomonas_salina.3